MEVDRARRQGSDTLVCYRCGKVGHMAKDCKVMIRSLIATWSPEERNQMLEALLAAADISGEPTGEYVEEEVEEDFGNHNE